MDEKEKQLIIDILKKNKQKFDILANDYLATLCDIASQLMVEGIDISKYNSLIVDLFYNEYQESRVFGLSLLNKKMKESYENDI